MKTYSNSEALALLEENPKLKFENKTGERTFTLYSDDNKIYVLSDREILSGFLLGDRWTIKQEAVTFIEAVNSGKKIRSEYWEKEEYINTSLVFKSLHEMMDDDMLECINGKWYIESENE